MSAHSFVDKKKKERKKVMRMPRRMRFISWKIVILCSDLKKKFFNFWLKFLLFYLYLYLICYETYAFYLFLVSQFFVWPPTSMRPEPGRFDTVFFVILLITFKKLYRLQPKIIGFILAWNYTSPVSFMSLCYVYHELSLTKSLRFTPKESEII